MFERGLSRPDDYFETLCIKNGCELVAGVDEAGRGPLAGPVVAAAVILPVGLYIKGLNDSKKLKAETRAKLFETIMSDAVSIGVGLVSAAEIDELNILRAALEAMRIAVQKLSVKPDFILVDGHIKAPIDIPQQTIKKGDGKSVSIAAASIIAKVTRDKIMDELHEKYPQYNFRKNKGYGTEDHVEALRKFGPSPIHRLTFRQVR